MLRPLQAPFHLARAGVDPYSSSSPNSPCRSLNWSTKPRTSTSLPLSSFAAQDMLLATADPSPQRPRGRTLLAVPRISSRRPRRPPPRPLPETVPPHVILEPGSIHVPNSLVSFRYQSSAPYACGNPIANPMAVARIAPLSQSSRSPPSHHTSARGASSSLHSPPKSSSPAAGPRAGIHRPAASFDADSLIAPTTSLWPA